MTGARGRVLPHRFLSDGTRDHKRSPLGCRLCPLPYRHPVHQVTELPVEVSVEQARRLRERE